MPAGNMPIKLLILGDLRNSHTLRWATDLTEYGLDVTVFSLHPPVRDAGDLTFKTIISRVFTKRRFLRLPGLSPAIKYLACAREIRHLCRKLQPDLCHAHYAISYGFLGALAGVRPFVVSIWGSDVFYHPRHFPRFRHVLRYTFKKAGAVFSTSHAMAKESRRYGAEKIHITPFGVDTDLFRPRPDGRRPNEVRLGTFKPLEHLYGIDTLIRAFAGLKEKHPEKSISLLICGDGSLRSELEQLAADLAVKDQIVFAGRVPHWQVPTYINRVDIGVFPSRHESFGVAVLECSACEKPVVTSNVEGLPEVVREGITGFMVPPDREEALEEALEHLILHPEVRQRLGKQGRYFVEQHYRKDHCVAIMVEHYKRVLREAAGEMPEAPKPELKKSLFVYPKQPFR